MSAPYAAQGKYTDRLVSVILPKLYIRRYFCYFFSNDRVPGFCHYWYFDFCVLWLFLDLLASPVDVSMLLVHRQKRLSPAGAT
jgi:hypothetical protein